MKDPIFAGQATGALDLSLMSSVVLPAPIRVPTAVGNLGKVLSSNGTTWIPSNAGAGDMVSANALSELTAAAATARGNIGAAARGANADITSLSLTTAIATGGSNQSLTLTPSGTGVTSSAKSIRSTSGSAIAAIEPEGTNSISTQYTNGWQGTDPIMRLRLDRPITNPGAAPDHLLMLPYEFGMLLDYPGVFEVAVGDFSVHRKTRDVGDGLGSARFWVGDEDDSGGLFVTAHSPGGGGETYTLLSSQKFIGQAAGDYTGLSHGDLRYNVVATTDSHLFQVNGGELVRFKGDGSSIFSGTVRTTGNTNIGGTVLNQARLTITQPDGQNALNFTNSTNSKVWTLYQSGNDFITFEGGAAEAARFKAGGGLVLAGNAASNAGLELTKTAHDTVSVAHGSFYFDDTSLNAGLLGQQTLSAPYTFAVQAQDRLGSTQFPIALNAAGGNVGIGYAMPGSKLEVVKTASDTVSVANAAAYLDDVSLNAGLILQQKATAPYAFVLQAQDRIGSTFFPLSLNPLGGNLLIGATTTVTTHAGTTEATTGGAGAVVAAGGIYAAKKIISASTLTGTQLVSTISTGTAPLSVTSTTRVSNLNVATAGTADTLTTPRAIYGNNFDGSAALGQIIASTYGGTGNGFTKFSGPASTEKTFTLPDASATLVYQGGALGTPSSGVGTNLTALTAANISAGALASGMTATTQSANDNTTKLATTAYVQTELSDYAADTVTFTNKRVTARVQAITSNATPTTNTDSYDCVNITAQAAAITSMSTNLSGTPSNFDQLEYRIKDDGTPRAITWGASFISGPATLPTTTTTSKALHVYFEYDSAQSKWVCMSTGSDA